MRGSVPPRIAQAMAIAMLSPLALGLPATLAASSPPCITGTFTGGDGYSGAVSSSGQVFTWGRNFEGQLGIGAPGGELGLPTPVITTTGLTTATGVWAGESATFAVDPSGQLWAWGDNSFGQRGSLSQFMGGPGMVVGPTHVVSVGAGAEHTIAATADGTLWGWGYALAFGVQVSGSLVSPPVVVPGLSNVSSISAGGNYSLVATANGSVFAAGQNDSGQLGLGSGVSQADTFQLVPGLGGIVDVAASDAAGGSFSVVLDGSGHVLAFGSDFYGEMGNGSISQTTLQYTPTQVQGLDSVVSIAAGNGHVLALKADHTVWSWGQNDAGQLGNGGMTNSATPGQVSFPAGVQLVAIAAGLAHSMALDSSGNLWAWGDDSSGELGNGFTSGGEVTQPAMVNFGTVAVPCAPQPKTYLPSINGYAFTNPGGPPATVPSYDRMALFYPSSRFEIFYPFTHTPTFLANWFNSNYFVSTYTGGLCYGMAASDQFLYNTFPDQSTVTLYPAFPGAAGTFPGALGASPSPSDTNIEQFIDRYHSRQLAAAGVEASIGTWEYAQLTGGNRGALDTIATAVAAGKTEWVGLGPSRVVLTETLNPFANKDRFSFLFNESHAVLAYRVEKSLGRIDVYDPNSPLDDKAYIQLVNSSINPGGGIEVVHNGDASIPANVSYGGGINPSGTDFGLSGEWQMMPLTQAAFTDQGSVPPFDNRHWMLDLVNPIALIAGASLSTLLGEPIFRMLGSSAQSPMESELLPSGSGLNEVVATARSGAQTSLKSGSSATDVIETDDTAGGTTHRVSISPDASQVILSNASSVQLYGATFGSDFLASSYGRTITINGATLAPGGTLDLATDPTYSTFSMSASAMPGGQANLVLTQLGQGAGSASVTATIPGNGGRGTVFVGDWTGLGQSLVFEVVTGPSGQVTGLLLQDNPGQRDGLTAQLLQSIQSAIGQLPDGGIRNSLEAKLNNAAKQIGKGHPGPAANVLEALGHEVAAQTGKAVPTDVAASLTASLAELIGLLRASSV